VDRAGQVLVCGFAYRQNLDELRVLCALAIG